MPTSIFALILFTVILAGATTALAVSLAPISTLIPIALIAAIVVRLVLRHRLS